MRHSPTFWRLFGTFSGLLFLTVVLLGGLIYHRIRVSAHQQLEQHLHHQVILLREAFGASGAPEARSLQERAVSISRQIGTYVTLIDKDGRILADSEGDLAPQGNLDTRPEIQAARASGYGTDLRISETRNGPVRYVALAAGPGELAIVRVGLPLQRADLQLAELPRILWVVVAVVGLTALGGALWLGGRFTSSLNELTECTRRIAAGDYGHKVYPRGEDELAVLARGFNHMSERLEVQFAQLAEDRAQLRMILGGMIEGVVALDAEQRILFANERAGQLLNFTPQAVAGRKLWEVVRRRGLQELVRRALNGPVAHREELTWNGPGARSLTVHAARLPGSPPRGAVLVLHDTSELRHLESVRQEFVANVSHELKTPLSVITACVETLIDGAVEDPVHRGPFLQRIGEQADRLHALILDLLSLARIESGKEVLELQNVSLGPVVAACLDRHRTRAEAKNQSLEGINPGDAAEISAWADEEAIDHILDNLVDNALKYTPARGSVRVRWRTEGDDAVLEVEDTGIGIPEHDLPRVFERFYRVDRARSRELGGTGLGLSIVKHLVQALRGSVHAASVPGQGSTFTVRLPRGPAS